MLRLLPSFGCQTLRRAIEQHTGRRLAALNKVYEFQEPSTALPHRRLHGRRDLLFLFELGRDAR